MVYLIVKENHFTPKVDCTDEACVRFCCVSNCEKSYDFTNLTEAEDLKKNFSVINGNLCAIEKFHVNFKWKFEKVKNLKEKN